MSSKIGKIKTNKAKIVKVERCTNIGGSKDRKTERIEKQEIVPFRAPSLDAINK